MSAVVVVRWSGYRHQTTPKRIGDLPSRPVNVAEARISQNRQHHQRNGPAPVALSLLPAIGVNLCILKFKLYISLQFLKVLQSGVGCVL